MKWMIKHVPSVLQLLFDTIIWLSTTSPLTHKTLDLSLEQLIGFLVDMTLDVMKEEGVVDELETFSTTLPFTY